MSALALLSLVPLAWGQAPGELLSPANAGEAVDRFANALLVVEGARAYPPEEIARAVTRTPRFLIASHPRAPLAEYLAYVEENVRLGYLLGGFPEVKVEALLDRKRSAVHVAVDEGPRCTAGPVVVEGNQALPSEDIVAVLTRPRLAPEPDDPGRELKPHWKTGEPVPLDPGSLRRAVQLVESAYARAGRLQARIEVLPRREENRISLAVRVVAEEAPSTLGEVRFRGRFTDDPEDVMRAAGIGPGMPLDSAVKDSLQAKLAALGRFVEPSVRTVPGKEEGKIDLEIEIWQVPFAPPFGEPPPAHEPALRKAVAWLSDAGRWKGPLVYHADAPKLLADLGLTRWVESGSLDGGVSARGLLLEASYRTAGGLQRIGFILDANRGLLIAAPLRLISRFELRAGPVVRGNIRVRAVNPRDAKPGDDSLRLNLGLSLRQRRNAAEPGFTMQPAIDATALTCFAHRQEIGYATDGGLLGIDHLPEEGDRQRIASVDRETGEVELQVKKQVEGMAVSVSFEKVGIAERFEAASEEARTNAYEEVPPLRFLALTAAGGARLERFVRGKREGAQVRVLDPLLRNLLRNEEEAARYIARLLPLNDAFVVPREPMAGEDVESSWPADEIIGTLAACLATDMPRGSWPEALLREGAAVVAGGTDHTAAEIRRILNSPDVGPVGFWAFAEGLRLAGKADLSRTFAREALHAGAAGFRKDIEAFRSPGYLPARLLAALGKAVQDLDAAVVESLRADAERLGDEAEREFVGLLDRARAEKEPAASGALLLEAYWNAGLAAALRARCEQLSDLSA